MLKLYVYIPCMMLTAIRIILQSIKPQWLPVALFRKFSAMKHQVPGFHLCLRFFESVKEEYFSLKLTALKKHKSQSQRDYMRPERLRAVAQFRGQQVNSDLGEGFVIHKMIL
ncbi:LmbE-like protein [Escherichia coli]|uniref:LmbE-like protein n=1 Tax=Escherichia coli TaxID=562 RepID=A0A376VZ32_ECOLX|nr:LmbE-like protein [Escherichia coli]